MSLQNYEKKRYCRTRMNTHHVTLRQDTEGIELGKGQEDGEGDENECNQEVESLFQNGHTSS